MNCFLNQLSRACLIFKLILMVLPVYCNYVNVLQQIDLSVQRANIKQVVETILKCNFER